MMAYVKHIKRTDIIAVTLIILAGVVMLYLWHLNPEFRATYVGESFVDANQFIPGTNFKQIGFWKLHFTADYAMGAKEYHPFYYTHNPPLSEIINGIYQKAGLVRIEQQRLVCILWTLLSYLFFYLAMKTLINPTVALWSSIIALCNPYILYWGDNTFASHQLMFVYASIYFLLRYIRNNSFTPFIISWCAFLFAAFCNYELIPFMIIFPLGLKILKLERLSFRKLLFFLSAPLVAFCLRNILVIWSIGYNAWFSDLIEIFLHRTFGITTPLIKVYKEFPILLWVPKPEIAREYLWLLYNQLGKIYGYGWDLFLIAVLIPYIRRWILPQALAPRLSRIIPLFFIMGTIWYLLFPQHTSEHLHSLPMLFFLPFASLIWGSVLVGLWQNAKRFPVKIACAIAVLGALVIMRVLSFYPPRPFPGIRTLPKYEGRVLCTNAIPSLVEYYTKVPVAFCGYEEQFNELLQGKYNFFLNSQRASLPKPEFFFAVYGWNDDGLNAHFLLIERGDDFAIYLLQPKPGSQEQHSIPKETKK